MIESPFVPFHIRYGLVNDMSELKKWPEHDPAVQVRHAGLSFGKPVDDPLQCRCSCTPLRCSQRMTAEDMRCDACRDWCYVGRADGGPSFLAPILDVA